MRRQRLARRAGLALPIGTGMLLVVGATLIALFVATNPGALPVHTVVPLFYNVPLALAFAVVSAVVVNRLPGHPIGWLFGVVGVSVAASLFTEGYVAWELPGESWVLLAWTVLSGPTFFCLAMALLLFPTGRPASPPWRWLGRLLWAYLAAALLVTAVAPWTALGDFLVVRVQERRGEWPPENPVGWDNPAWLADANALVVPVGIVLMLAALLSLLPRWRRAAGDERQQLKWLGLAAMLAVLELVVGLTQTLAGQMPEDDPVAELIGNAIFVLMIAGIPVAVGLGIVRYRLYDIDVVINKTVVYGGLAVFIGLAYVVSVVGAGELVGRWSGSSTVLALAVTATVAVAFQPLRRRLQAAADRWVFGERAAPYELMTTFGHELGQAMEPANVLARIAETAAIAARARTVRVSATLHSGETLSAAWPTDDVSGGPQAAMVPIHDEGEVIGEIAVTGPQLAGADLALLRDIAATSSSALRNVRLLARLESLRAIIEQQNQQIDASRRRLVAAAEAERQRTALLVEEQLEPDLTVLRDTVPGLRAAVRTDPDAVAAGCQRLAVHATRVVEQIRTLTSSVHPPLLSDHGLAAALRALLRRLDLDATLTIEPSARVRFPSHVETTAYLCCRAALEAATEGRSAAALRLWHDDGALAFSIVLDKPGSPHDGLAIVRDRVTTLGGTLNIDPGDHWSRVTGTVPTSPMG